MRTKINKNYYNINQQRKNLTPFRPLLYELAKTISFPYLSSVFN